MIKKVLAIEIPAEYRQKILLGFDSSVYQVEFVAYWPLAISMLLSQKAEFLISPIPSMSSLGFEYYVNSKYDQELRPTWILICSEMTPQCFEVCSKLALPDILYEPLEAEKIQLTLRRIQERALDPILEIMDVIQVLVGIYLPKDKKSMVYDRIMRRAFALGFQSLGQYLIQFRKNRSGEVSELVSAITTHTTSFFREEEQFCYLFDSFLPNHYALYKDRPKKIRIWSAACSTGEEVYSTAITVLEFFRNKGIYPEEIAPLIEIHGTDVDPKSVKFAKAGIYLFKNMKLKPEIFNRYFDRGTGNLSHLVKIKNFVHKLCRFDVLNLLSPFYPGPYFQCVFLRNILIYFRNETIQQIVSKIASKLETPGFLFLGKSEALHPLQAAGLDIPYRSIGNSIYQKLDSHSPEQHFVGSVFETIKIKKKENLIKAGSELEDDKKKGLHVLLIDGLIDEAKTLKEMLAEEKEFSVISMVNNFIEANNILSDQRPVDIILMNISGLISDGVIFVQSLKGKAHPPIIILTTLNYNDAANTMKCLELGALDYIQRPEKYSPQFQKELVSCLKNATLSKGQPMDKSLANVNSSSRISGNYMANRAINSIHNLIVIGSSTGGVDALSIILRQFPKKTPAILVVQHVHREFSKALALRLREICEVEVKEACNNDEILDGHAYIAPGGVHMKVEEVNGKLRILLSDTPPVMGNRPSVDYLFNSVAEYHKNIFIAAALLTGMGSDGAQGLKKLRDSGAYTVAQNEATSVVFGMPKAAIDLGAAMEIVPLDAIAGKLYRFFERKSAA